MPNQHGLWFMKEEGWQQHRKNEAAYNIFWENNGGTEADGEAIYWDYKNHCWTNPNQMRMGDTMN